MLNFRESVHIANQDIRTLPQCVQSSFLFLVFSCIEEQNAHTVGVKETDRLRLIKHGEVQ